MFSGGSVGCHLCSPEEKYTISLFKQTHKHSQGICVLLVFSQSDTEPSVQRKQKTIKILKRLRGLCLLLLKGSVTVLKCRTCTSLAKCVPWIIFHARVGPVVRIQLSKKEVSGCGSSQFEVCNTSTIHWQLLSWCRTPFQRKIFAYGQNSIYTIFDCF